MPRASAATRARMRRSGITSSSRSVMPCTIAGIDIGAARFDLFAYHSRQPKPTRGAIDEPQPARDRAPAPCRGRLELPRADGGEAVQFGLRAEAARDPVRDALDSRRAR